MNQTALATTRASAPPAITGEILKHESEQRKLLGEYVREQLIEGTDYGVIPGTEKKTLLKPGAEKLTQVFRCLPQFELEDRIENWETGLFYYRFHCKVVTQADGVVVAEGFGSCSTFESRYRWRNADRVCPNCGKAAIKKSKFPPKGQPDAKPGWYCFDKLGGCGANYSAEDPAITGQVVGRVQNPDLLDQVNTVLKIAKKRALVDAAIALARCSDVFTQDLEDQESVDDVPAPRSAPPSEKPALDEKTYLEKLTKSSTYDELRTVVEEINKLTSEGKLTKAQMQVLTPVALDMKKTLTRALNGVDQPPTSGPSSPDAERERLVSEIHAKLAAEKTHPSYALGIYAEELGLSTSEELPVIGKLSLEQLRKFQSLMKGAKS